MELKFFKHILKGDKVIWTIYFFLSLISIIEVYSAASTLSFKSGDHWGPIINHIINMVIGFIMVWGVHIIPCRWFKILPVILIPCSIFFLILVYAFGAATNDAARWISIFGFQFQPSEMAKAAVIITVAMILANMQEEKSANPKAFKYIMSITIIICALIAPENLSTAALLFGVVLLMMFIGRIPKRQLGTLVAGLVALGALAISVIMIMPEEQPETIADATEQVENVQEAPKAKSSGILHRFTTWKHRIQGFFADDQDGSYDDSLRGENAQVVCAKTAISTSNIFGKMPGNSELCDLLPQPYSDFIYAIIVEEMGFFGGFVVVFLYIILLIRAGRIAGRSERNFPAFLIMGISLMMVSQAIMNMLVVVGLFPVTGQPLPLISRGGSAIVSNCFYFGIMLSVSRYVKKKQDLQVGINLPEPEPAMTKEYYNDENMN
ncbi:MAG: FtsW/RodA/SpoVE family cell cycle protein [Bacteroidaceae bacterium]|nr:FtsW/RodA/SpoVE family cell cycle protein [Bacteroidaceae bacterium]